MKNLQKKNFDIPKIIGALTEEIDNIPRQIRVPLKRNRDRIAFLPFQIESKFLKNTID